MEVEETILCAPAYYRGRWVNVPLYYAPRDAYDGAENLDRIQVTILDGQKVEPMPTRDCKMREKKWESALESILPWTWSDNAIKQLCKRNDIPLAWVTNRFARKKCSISESGNRRQSRQNRFLTPKEATEVKRQLKKINKESWLIASILWFLNKILGKGDDFVTLEQILRLQVEDVAPEQENDSNWVRLMRSGSHRMHLISHPLPKYLWRPLCKQINEKSIFVFSNRKGGPLLAVHVERHLLKAGRSAKVDVPVTSLSFRPPSNKKCSDRLSAIQKNNNSMVIPLESVGIEQWKLIVEKFPSIIAKRGRKPIYDRRNLLNAILYHLNAPCPIRKLPDCFPPFSAVDCQMRQWKKNGILTGVIKFLKEAPAA